MRKSAYIVILTLLLPAFFSACKKETCSDGILNQSEDDIDCGGPCIMCPTCDDNIQNQDETGVDCGGSCSVCPTCDDGLLNQDELFADCGGENCDPCINRMRAHADQKEWIATSANGYYASDGLVVQGTDGVTGISITHNDWHETGTYPLSDYRGILVRDNGNYICICDTGSVTFITFDTDNRIVSGSFSFSCTDINGTGTSEVVNGLFHGIRY